jgi:methionine synthase I (cobalamin-dependent)
MGENVMRDNWKIVDTCKELEQRGADVAGMNCFRGPATMLPYLREIRNSLFEIRHSLLNNSRKQDCRYYLDLRIVLQRLILL